QRRDLALLLKLLHASLQPCLQFVGTLASPGRVETEGLAGLLLTAELRCAVIPVIDLLGQAVLYCCHCLKDQLLLAPLHLSQMLGHERRDSEVERLLLNLLSLCKGG